MQEASNDEIQEGQKISNRLHEKIPDDVMVLHERLGVLSCMNYVAHMFDLRTEEQWHALWAAFDLGAYMALCDLGLEN